MSYNDSLIEKKQKRKKKEERTEESQGKKRANKKALISALGEPLLIKQEATGLEFESESESESQSQSESEQMQQVQTKGLKIKQEPPTLETQESDESENKSTKDRHKKEKPKHKTKQKSYGKETQYIKREKEQEQEQEQQATTTTSSSLTSQSKQQERETQEFHSLVMELYVTIPPCYFSDMAQGINDQLNSFLMKYLPQVKGIVLSYSNIKILQKYARFVYDTPHSQFWISVQFLVWRPLKNEFLVGMVNLQSSDHIGLLLYNTFNASIPATSIPSSRYEWRANCSEASKPEEEEESTIQPSHTEEAQHNVKIEAEAMQEQKQPEGDVKLGIGLEEEEEGGGGGGETSTANKIVQTGQWYDKKKQQYINNDEYVLFVVLDLVSVNEMLTVTGSLIP